MENKKFDEALNKIFNITEAVLQPEVTGLVPPEGDSVDAFRDLVKSRLRGLKKSPEGTPPTQRGPGAPGEAIMEKPIVDVPYPDAKEVFMKVGLQPSMEAVLQKLSELLNVPVENLRLSPKPFPTGETGVFLKVDRTHPNPLHFSHGDMNKDQKPSYSTDNIGEIRPVSGGFGFKSHNNPTFAQLYAGNKVGNSDKKVTQDTSKFVGNLNRSLGEGNDAPAKTGYKPLIPPTTKKQPSPEERHRNEINYGPNGAVVRGPLDPSKPLKERENPISVGTIKNQVQNFGPEALGQIIAKLSPDMDKVDANGQPTSEYNQFVESIKQDGLEIILNASSAAGGVKTAPNGQANAKPASPAPGASAPEEPGQELASL